MTEQELAPLFEKTIKELMDRSKDTVAHEQAKCFLTYWNQM
jgi:hypothetical protein